MPRKKTKSKPDFITAQEMLFEDNYLMRMHRQLTSCPDTAFAELVANAWDAGALNVTISISDKKTEKKMIIIEDDGVGMTEQEFLKRWKTLAYNRLEHQGEKVVFPANTRKGLHRLAFGRNGIGRHGLLCFGSSYTVVSKSSEASEEIGYKISLGTQQSPLVFEKVAVVEPLHGTHGTRLTIQVEQRLPNPRSILRSLSMRFLYDPQFAISVNGESVDLEDLKQQLETKHFVVENRTFDMYILRAKNIESGIAFWQSGHFRHSSLGASSPPIWK